VDPTIDIVFVGMIQRMTSHDNHSLLYRSHAMVYQAWLTLQKASQDRNEKMLNYERNIG
jgi:hypothetical protein